MPENVDKPFLRVTWRTMMRVAILNLLSHLKLLPSLRNPDPKHLEVGEIFVMTYGPTEAPLVGDIYVVTDSFYFQRDFETFCDDRESTRSLIDSYLELLISEEKLVRIEPFEVNFSITRIPMYRLLVSSKNRKGVSDE